MSKIGARRTRYTQDEWRLFDRLIRDGAMVKQALAEMATRFGRAPSYQAGYNRVASQYTGTRYSEEYRKHAMDLARSGRYANAGKLAAALPLDPHGKRPKRGTVKKWLKHYGVKIQSSGVFGRTDFLASTKARALELLEQGKTIAQVHAILAGENPLEAPGRSTVEKWSWSNRMTEKRKKAGTKLQRVERFSVGFQSHRRADLDLPDDTPQWIRDQAILMAAYSGADDPKVVRARCIEQQKDGGLWWSPETSTNPRWNPEAGQQAGRLAA